MPAPAELIVEAREKRGGTQEELAAEAGLSRRTIQRAESGARISARVRQDLAATLEIPIEDLVVEETEGTGRDWLTGGLFSDPSTEPVQPIDWLVGEAFVQHVEEFHEQVPGLPAVGGVQLEEIKVALPAFGVARIDITPELGPEVFADTDPMNDQGWPTPGHLE